MNLLKYIFKSAVISIWLIFFKTYAQIQEHAFSETYSFVLDQQYDDAILFPESESNTVILIWSKESKSILFSKFDSELSSVQFTKKYIDFNLEDIIPVDINNDKKTDLLILDKESKSIASILNLKSDSLKIKNKIELPFIPEQIIPIDVNNDKLTDLLIYSKKNMGIYPLINDGRGKFALGNIISPNNAVGAVDIACINNDNIKDIVFWDWVKSEFHILYGVGKSRFLNYSVFPTDAEYDRINILPIFRKHSVDILFRNSSNTELHIWEGNEFGDFKLKSKIQFPEKIIDYDVNDFNNDNLNDIIACLNNSALQVVFNNRAQPFEERTEYACGAQPFKIFIPNYRNKKTKNCIVFDKERNKLIILKHIKHKRILADSVQLVTGINPVDVITRDFNRDGIADIALINKGSKSISLYYGQKGYIPLGPYSLPLSQEPSRLAFHSSTDSTLNFVISFASSNLLSFLTFDSANTEITNAYIGAEGDTELLEASIDRIGKSRFITINQDTSSTNSLSIYEQIQPNTFIEHTFRISQPSTLIGASIADLNNDKYPDIIYLFRSGLSPKVELAIAFGDSSYTMRLRLISKEFEFPNITSAYIWLADFNKDKIQDLLLYAGKPINSLFIAKGKGNGLFYEAKEILKLNLKQRSDIKIIDVNQDNLNDIVYRNYKLGSVSWLRNDNNFDFAKPHIIKYVSGYANYTISDLDGDGLKDLTIILTNEGILKIFSGKILNINIEN